MKVVTKSSYNQKKVDAKVADVVSDEIKIGTTCFNKGLFESFAWCCWICFNTFSFIIVFDYFLLFSFFNLIEFQFNHCSIENKELLLILIVWKFYVILFIYELFKIFINVFVISFLVSFLILLNLFFINFLQKVKNSC